jgi:hypothetical protein
MGLTIHYGIVTPADWQPKDIKAKLEQARQFAKTLPVVSVSDLVEFRGKQANYRAGREEQDEFHWAKLQAERSLVSPWQPGSFGSQPPTSMIVFSVLPTEGCEQMNIGSCSFPEHLWPAEKSEKHVPAWSLALDKRNPYPESERVLRAFMRRWKLRRLPKSRFSASERFGGSTALGCFAHNGLAQATVRKGRYVSHRRGYSGAVGIVTIRDRMSYELAFRYMGTAEEATAAFSSAEFRADLEAMVVGKEHITPPATGIWSSFCKTQFANDPRLGGWQNFVKGHLAVLAILEHLQALGFKVTVDDEGGFWEGRDLQMLAKKIGQYDALLAGMAGAMKDAAGEHGMDVESPMSGRPDFERLEMEAHQGCDETLRKLMGMFKPDKKP